MLLLKIIGLRLPFNRPLIHVVSLVLAVAIVYWPVYRFDFLYGWDDQWFVTNHYTENGLNWPNLWDILTHFHYGQYAPVNQLYYTILYAIFEYDPMYYHIVGVCVHAVNVVLVYRLICTVSPHIIKHAAIVHGDLGFIVALLFAILPINIEPVAWVSASKVTLYALFYLLGLQLYCHYLASSKSAYFYLTLLCFVFSFGAKEQAVTLPLCLILFDHIFGRNLTSRMVWLEKFPFFVVTLLFGLATIQSQGLEGSGVFYPAYQRIPLAAYTLSEYFTKILIPVNLSYIYPFPFEIGEEVPWWLWLYVCSVPTIIYFLFSQIRIKWVSFGLLFFSIHIVLVSNILSMARYSVVADRYAYLATIGLCFILGYLFLVSLRNRTGSRITFMLGLLYTIVLFAYSSHHIWVWENAYTLKEKLKKTIEQRDDFEKLKKLKDEQIP